MELILFLAGVFLATYLIGKLLERIKIPWIFSALLIGLALAAYNPFKEITGSPSFKLLAELGMYFMLFIIGFELDFKKIKKNGGFIAKTTIAIILSESLVGTFLLHYVFNYSWMISGLVSISFATVGEAMLLPILDEFKLTKTKLGQTILGIGVLDDLVEIITIILVSLLLGFATGHTEIKILFFFGILALLFAMAYGLSRWKNQVRKLNYGYESFFLFIIFFIFLFIGIGKYIESAPLGALLAGVALKSFIPDKKLKTIENEIRTMAYGFFAPIFFLWVGVDTDVAYIIKYPLMIILIMLMVNLTKVTTSYLMGRNVLGSRESIIMGISLCVKFSTSIVIIKILFENGFIQSELYSILVGTTILFKFIVPSLLSFLLKRWNISPRKYAS